MNKNITMWQLTAAPMKFYYRTIMLTISDYLRILKHICHLAAVWFRLSSYHNLRVQKICIVNCTEDIDIEIYYNE